ncbi:MAG: tolB protein [Polyangiaceae bacterium]|nr:tolB protein [Polyangiaceae bacterium]
MTHESKRYRWKLAAAVGVALATVLGGAPILPETAQAQPAAKAEDDPLANIVVPADAATQIPLPKIAVLSSTATDMENVNLFSVVRRDIELSGEFDILTDDKLPDGPYVGESIDVKAYEGKGAEAILRVTARKLSDTKAELRGQAFVVSQGDMAVYDKRFEVPIDRVRTESHYVADQLIGALTGTQGGFFSHLTFVSGTGSLRRVYRIDSDGFDAKPISPQDHVAIAPAYGSGGELFWSASVNKDEYKIFKASEPTKAVKTNVKGSVYGLAFNKDYSQIAVSIGVGDTIKVYTGPAFDQLKEASPIGMAFRPGFTPTGKLAFAGEGKFGQRVYVDGKPISPDGLFASAPTFCRHPDGIRTVFAVGAGKKFDLVATGETGGQLVRLTQGMGSNNYPACSPDGRMIAFFSTKPGGEGLYVMRLGGGSRPKRISTLMGDSLRWDRLPPSHAVEKK